jgi:hypothetical protein
MEYFALVIIFGDVVNVLGVKGRDLAGLSLEQDRGFVEMG